MIKPDWKIFEAKFSGNPQENFEWLCYILFCLEYKKDTGIFRYKNQSGIETNPISLDKYVIGWQSKFYDTTLSVHKKELIETLEKSKRDYPKINKIIFYTNQEWGQSHISDKPEQNDPQSKIEVEAKANELKIEIDWKTASFFESPFVTIENELVTKHFFTFETSIFQVLLEKELHTESILDGIQTSISFQDKNIEIKRNNLLQSILDKMESEQILVVSGIGGVGKTSVVKKLYEDIKDDSSFYIFKASEFETNHINTLFSGCSFKDFLEVHREDEKKIIVVDSAEKILDLESTDPFNEFINTLIKYGWKIIFTTRSNYLSDLDMQFIDHYKVKPFKFYIEPLTLEELIKYAQKYSFNLPSDEKLLEVLKNPFYLNEFLKLYNYEGEINNINFKDKLWDKVIKKTKPLREQCFMKIAFQRANEGQFFISPSFDELTMSSLLQDGVLGYETAGYFITHDIYEEWALEKKIDSEFIKRVDLQDFFNKIGESLSIRRSFRKWVSDKLLLEDRLIENLIEEVLESESLSYFWKDEILISILLSPYSNSFINIFEKEILERNHKLLKRITFLLRVACKEVDEEYLKLIDFDKYLISDMKYIVTKPKGLGWNNIIKLIYENKDSFEIQTINYILPVIYEWNNKYRNGESTRLSALLALKYYNLINEKGNYAFRANETEEKIIQTILYGANEISSELTIIFSKVIDNNWRKHRDPYYSLINAVLTKLGDNREVLKVLPRYVLKLAELHWIKHDDLSQLNYSNLDIADDFSICSDKIDYYPASAFQTPIYWLLNYAFKDTIDFIIRFVNHATESYAKSDLSEREIEEVEVNINNKMIKQYISNRLWNTYRGTQGSPEILESIHMALEKFLLEQSKLTDSEILEQILLYLIENSKSASLTAVVTSVVIANYEKTFNVAKVLFKTKKFFFYDSTRMFLDQTAINTFGIGYGMNVRHKIHQDERIQSCDHDHRKKTLEMIALMYQFFRNEDTTDDEATDRKKILWGIFDDYYLELKNTSFEEDRKWRLFLTRMDRRNMNPIVEKVDQGIQIDFNPEIDDDLTQYRESALQKSYEATKYLSLKLWSDFKFKNDQQFREYTKYEDNPLLALQETKEMIGKIQSINEEVYVLERGVPSYVCAVLIRDHFNLLSQVDKEKCKEIILTFASASLSGNYSYQIGDGVEAAIATLPILSKHFPEEKEYIKIILLLTLFDNHPIGLSIDFANYTTNAILNQLWNIEFEDANSLLLGYLYLKPKYEDMRVRFQKENFDQYRTKIVEEDFLNGFLEEYEDDIEKVLYNKITFEEIENISDISPRILKTAFQLIPLGTSNVIHKCLIKNIVSVFSEKLLLDDRRKKMDYKISHDFLMKLAEIVLCSSNNDTQDYLSPFINKFTNSEFMADLFKEFIYAQDRLKKHDEFWLVWDLFFEQVVELNQKFEDNYGNSQLIKSLLFAENLWNDNIKEWHSLTENNKRFLLKVTRRLGDSPATLYSISKMLNGIGNQFIKEGISWISNMLSDNKDLWNDKLENNTIYYLENVVKNYIHIEYGNIRREAKSKKEILTVLDFLVEKGSVAGYMLRESIL